MKINYSNYSYAELLDVKNNIDKDAHPERFQALLEEITLREKQAPSQQAVDETEDNNDSQSWDKLTIHNLKTPLYRYIFGSLFLAGFLYFLIQILPSLFHTSLSNLPAYKTEIHKIECKEHTYRYKGKNRTYYNLELTSYGFTFYVPNMKVKHCKRSAFELKAGNIVTIWYENDLIYQIANKQDVYLPYRYLKRYVWHENINNIFNYLLAFVFYVGIFYKSFINCIKPNTYVVSTNNNKS